jgi:Gpi18-like mannosyltransferase
MARFSFNKREIFAVAMLLFAAFVVRLMLFPLPGFGGDLLAYMDWFKSAANGGIRPFYTNVPTCDYPPFNVYIFWVGGSLVNATSAFGVSVINIVKLIPNIFDIATAALIYLFLRKQLSFRLSLVGTALYAFNPAVIYNAAVWGQFDAVYTFFLVLSLMLALKSKPKLSAVVFAIAILTKPQAIALAPLIIYLIYRKSGLKQLALSSAGFVASVFLVILPFEWSNPVTFLTNAYFGAYNHYEVTSVNAFNVWALFGVWAPENGLYPVGWALFGILAALTLFVLHKRFKTGDWLVVFSAFLLFFAFFMLPTRIHERYLFPAISMLSLMFVSVKYSRPLYVALTGTFLVNQAYILILSNQGIFLGFNNVNLAGDPILLAVSSINIIMLFYATALMLAALKGKGGFNQNKEQNTKNNSSKKGNL